MTQIAIIPILYLSYFDKYIKQFGILNMAINLNDIANKTMKLFQGNGHQMKMFDADSGKSVATPERSTFLLCQRTKYDGSY